MTKVALFGHFKNSYPKESVKIVIDFLIQNNIEVSLESECAKVITPNYPDHNFGLFKSHQDLNSSTNFLICIGGDGTILRALTYVRDSLIPVIGVNTGRLGFLATIQKDRIQDSLKAIFNNEYSISERSLLQLQTENNTEKELNGFAYALNEIAVSRKNTTSMITVQTYLNQQHLTSYWADGLIVATPTGSTGYSLSCGGPVITPKTNSLVLTPIAPHNLNARPLVIPENTEITLRVSGREDFHLISLDSNIITVKNETLITIKKADFPIKMIEPNNENFLQTLRNKLLWGEDKRN